MIKSKVNKETRSDNEAQRITQLRAISTGLLRRYCVLIIAVVSVSSCKPSIPSASFARQRTSVVRGSMLGPFQGQVLAAATNRPIEGASVTCSWYFTHGVGASAPSALIHSRTQTDADGRYTIASINPPRGGLTSELSRFSLIVMNDGYVTYRHNRTFGNGQPHTRFTQLTNTVHLKQKPNDISHAEHLLFDGIFQLDPQEHGSERQAAAIELSRQHTDSQVTPPDADSDLNSGIRQHENDEFFIHSLLTEDEISEITGFDGLFVILQLHDPGDSHESLHFRAVDQSEYFDIALRLWHFATKEQLVNRYAALRTALAPTKSATIADSQGFLTTTEPIVGFSFMHELSGTLVLISCGQLQCPDENTISALAAIIEKKLTQKAEADETTARVPSKHENP